MRKCRKIKKLLIPFYLQELSNKKINRVKSHLGTCETCLQEYKKIKQFFKIVKENKKEVEKVMSSMKWDYVSSIIMEKVKEEIAFEKGKYFFQIFSLKPILSISISLILLIGIMVLLLFQPWSKKYISKNEFFISSSSFENIESFLAKEEAINYLKQSQLLLTDLMKFSSPEEVDSWTINFNSQKAKNLLIQKKYFDERLNHIDLMKAKKICNQIEFLFHDIIELKDQPYFENIRKIQRIIKREQLLLRIRLIEQELS